MIPVYEPVVDRRDISAVVRQMSTSWVGPGAAVERFEKMICKFTGAEHCVVTNSGTSGLMLSLWAICKSGTPVYFPSYAMCAGANAATILGNHVRLIDIDETTLCMDPELLHPSHNSVVIFVDHNGYTGIDRGHVKAICTKSNAWMIEDACQSFGRDGAGLVGDVGVFSFSAPKLVTTGQGGAVVTNSGMIASRLRKLRDHGGDWRSDMRHKAVGVNLRMPDILAAYGMSQLNRIGELLEKRRTIISWYNEFLLCHIPVESWCVSVRCKDPDGTQSALEKRGYAASRMYRPMTHHVPYRRGSSFEVAEKAYKQLLYLPSSLNMKQSDIVEICEILRGNFDD